MATRVSQGPGRAHHRFAAVVAVAGACLWGMGTGAHAVGDPRFGTLVFEYENDIFAGEDRQYTSGVRLTWISPDERVPGWVRRGARRAPFFPARGELKLSYALGQNMYTPDDITDPDPDPDDRPYAGWLHATVGVGEESDGQLDRLQLTLGVVGPASGAKRTQKEVHRWINADRPEGWRFQLRNEPTLMVSYERQWRALVGATGRGWGADLTPHAGGAAGTPFTFLNTGVSVRFGRNLPLDYGPPRIQPALPGSGLFVPRRRLGWYVFTGIDGRAVAYDLFLDGNTFRDSRSVDKRYFVGDIQVGFALSYQQVRLAYTHVWRSREFDTQATRQEFGAFSVSARF